MSATPPARPLGPLLAVSAGDPLGIGPEVTLKALADPALRAKGRFALFADAPTLARAAATARIAPFWRTVAANPQTAEPAGPPPAAGEVVLINTPADVSPSPTSPSAPPGPTREGGAASAAWVRSAMALCKLEPRHPWHAGGILTAPIAKESWQMAGVHYPGHTEMLAEFFESPKSAMLFDGPSLRVVLATVHIPLAHVPTRLSTPRIAECIDLASQACREAGIAAPRVAAAGLNPHAGEHGLFGDEDARLIAPAVAAARAAGIDAHGPIPGDVVFLHAVKGRYHAVVAMYHDQGLIPVKLLDRERTVNVTAGLAWRGRGVVRTSPAHGTAFDIAGTGTADPASMHRAAELALTLMARAGAAPHT